MNKINLWNWALKFLKIFSIPLLVALLLIACPWLRGSLTNTLQTHPIWGGLCLSAFFFLVGFLLIGRNVTMEAELANQYRDVAVTLIILALILGVGIVFVGASTVFASMEIKSAAFRAMCLWSLAYFLAGFFVGFLFGIPRVLQENSSPQSPGAPNQSPQGYAQRVNTNLEQISDWLTKIIVGVGLVELKGVPAHLKSAAMWIAQSISATDTPSSATVSFAGSIIIFFSVVGFLAGYLITRLFLAGAFGRADQQPTQPYDLPVSKLHVSAFSDDSLGQRIRSFLRPGGIADPDAEQKINTWMKANGLEGRLISELVSTEELKKYREKVLADLKIP